MRKTTRCYWGPFRRWKYVTAVALMFISGVMLGAGAVAVSSDRAMAQAKQECTAEVKELREALQQESQDNDARYDQLRTKTEQHERELTRLMKLADGATERAFSETAQ